jgi:tetratricopeptide (TPR) repeat protein
MPRSFAAGRKKKTRLKQRQKDGSSSSNHNNNNKGKKAPPTVDALLQVATTSMASLDIPIAYQAFQQAATMLQKQQQEQASSSSSFSDDDTMKLIQTLEKMAECQVSMGDPDVAREHFVQALELLVSTNPEGMTTSSSSCSFLDTHSSLCLYIGQLSLEREALDAYGRGIRSLEQCVRQLEEKKDKETPSGDGAETAVGMMDQQQQEEHTSTSTTTPLIQLHELKQKLSKAYCNVAELYLTDLCDDENAENDCEQYLEQALQILDVDGEPLVDALQTMASLRLSQQPQEKQLEAVLYILRAFEKQRVGSEALATLVGLNHYDDDDDEEEDAEGTTMKSDKNEAKELLQLDAANNLPEFEFRCQTAKILLECAGLLKATRHEGGGDISTAATSSVADIGGSCTQSSPAQQEAECVSAAISVLGSLLAQNDEVVEIWYLTGCAFAAKFPTPLVDEARFYLDRAKEMLTEIRKSLQEEALMADASEQDDVEEQLEMNATQLQDVQTKLDELQDDDDAPMEE